MVKKKKLFLISGARLKKVLNRFLAEASEEGSAHFFCVWAVTLKLPSSIEKFQIHTMFFRWNNMGILDNIFKIRQINIVGGGGFKHTCRKAWTIVLAFDVQISEQRANNPLEERVAWLWRYWRQVLSTTAWPLSMVTRSGSFGSSAGFTTRTLNCSIV